MTSVKLFTKMFPNAPKWEELTIGLMHLSDRRQLDGSMLVGSSSHGRER